jgi:hypothetical protein
MDKIKVNYFNNKGGIMNINTVTTVPSRSNLLIKVPTAVIRNHIIVFLSAKDIIAFDKTSREGHEITYHIETVDAIAESILRVEKAEDLDFMLRFTTFDRFRGSENNETATKTDQMINLPQSTVKKMFFMLGSSKVTETQLNFFAVQFIRKSRSQIFPNEDTERNSKFFSFAVNLAFMSDQKCLLLGKAKELAKRDPTKTLLSIIKKRVDDLEPISKVCFAAKDLLAAIAKK